jgi:predicted nucleic acid-binding protein
MTAKERLVLDSSIALYWYFQDQADPYADDVAKQLISAEALVPSLWPLEVANAVLMGERRNRLTQADAQRWITVLETLPITLDSKTTARAWKDTLTLAWPTTSLPTMPPIWNLPFARACR